VAVSVPSVMSATLALSDGDTRSRVVARALRGGVGGGTCTSHAQQMAVSFDAAS
jgi:hypothetical protein